MPLTTGTRLGPYEIVSPLGAGGMGEVYRARDTRLDRAVAVKILPAHLSEDAEARQRFDREARTISSVNHPNICVLHDIGQQNGIDYLVMEYLDGETLADRLRKGPLPVEQVLRYAIEICEGLERAHRSGVIHRDLKPGNIMLSKAGAKLMDFGLAKPQQAGVVAASSGLSATMTSPAAVHPLTEKGVVVGTFQYMSPEQIEGKEADARSDIFSLGAVLYEMVTGKRAFEGHTATSAMAAVLEREPEPISVAKPMTPVALDRLVRTCLAKDPDERWQTAHDVGLQLKAIAEGATSASAIALPVGKRRHSNTFAWVVAAVLAMLAVVAVSTAYFADQKQPPVLRMEINPPEKLQFNLAGDNAGPAMLSPDGRYVVFSASNANGTHLYLRALDTLVSQPLAGTENAMFPFWSPDSRSIGFFTSDKLKRLDIAGGTPIVICDASLARGGSWNQDGTIVAALSYNAGIYRVPASGGTPTAITKVDNLTYSSHRWPWFLPDGRHFLYIGINHNSPSSAETGVFFASIDGKENRLLFHTLSNAIYTSGRLLYQRDNTLVAQPFDPTAGKFTGDPETLSEVAHYDAGIWRANVSASNTGMLAYASGTPSGIETLTWFDQTGKRLGTVGEQGGFFDIDLSPDEKALAFTDANTQVATIWTYDLATKRKTRLTFSGGAHRTPIWSPDGREIAFTSNQQAAISIKSVGGNAAERIVFSSREPSVQQISDWSRDGRYLMFTQGHSVEAQLWILPLKGDGKPFQYTNAPARMQEANGLFSPDGRWVAYQSNDTGRPEVFVAPFPWTGVKWQVSNGGGADVRWSADGKKLYYFDFSGIVEAEVNGSGQSFAVGNSKLLFRLPVRGLSREYAPTRDGKRFIAITPAEGSSQSLILVQNWTAALKKR